MNPYPARRRRPQDPEELREALEFSEYFAKTHGRGKGMLYVRHEFLRTPRAGGTPPVRALWEGGRGNDIAVKMLLALWWVLNEEPYTWDDRDVTSEGWGLLCGHPQKTSETDTGPAKAVKRAIERLTGTRPGSTAYITADSKQGRSPILTLCNYSHPSSGIDETAAPGQRLAAEDRYFRVPRGFIENGWMALLPGKALLVLLALIDHLDNGEPGTEMSKGERPEIESYRKAPIGPAHYGRQYGFGKDAWFDGLRLLRLWGLVKHENKLISPVPGVRRRPTSVVTVEASQLARTPGQCYDEAKQRFEEERDDPPDPMNKGFGPSSR